MKVLLINGSPRKDGSTAKALNLIEERLHTAQISCRRFEVGTQPVRGCVSCSCCVGTNRCNFNDDSCNLLIEQILDADAVIIGSPVYFSGANGALCALLDRAFYATCTRNQMFKGKLGAAFATCGWTGGTGVIDRLNRYFISTQMKIVSGSDYLTFTEDMIKKQDSRTMEILYSLADNMAAELKVRGEIQ